MKYERRKKVNLWKSNGYELSKEMFGTRLEKFILRHARKDPFLFTIENKERGFFVFLTKKDQNFRFIEDIIKREDISPDLSLVSRINVNKIMGHLYQLLDKDHFFETYNLIMSLYKSRYRLRVERYHLIIGKTITDPFYVKRPIDLYRSYLEGIFSKI